MKTNKFTHEDVQKHTLYLLKHLPLNENADIEIIILKGHLLIEEMIILLTSISLEMPECIGKMSFSQRLNLCHALLGDEHLSWEWGAIKQLNNARNNLAHNLDHPEKNKKIQDFLNLVEKHEPNPKNNGVHNLPQRLQWATSTLHKNLLTVVKNKSQQSENEDAM